MKLILIVLLLIFFTKNKSQKLNVKSVAIHSKNYEELFDIKINDKDYKIEDCRKIEFLNLRGMYLQTVPNDMVRSDAIRHVSLHHNSLKKFPQNILNHLPNLSCLNISHNNINLYKDNEVRHADLRVLDLRCQKMSDVNAIPTEVETFDQISKEMYEYMIFNSINMKLESLEYLDLSENDISTLLWDFNTSFPKLIRLDLMNINAEQLDPNFFNKSSTSLRILHLENNYLRNLTLPNIAEITSLYLDGNPIETLKIISTKLKRLSLTNCTNLSEILLDTPSLEELDLSRNNQNDINGIHFEMLRSLRILLLDYNEFSYVSIRNKMQWLHELSLSYNMIKYIKPHTFEHLVSLTKLSLKGNKIDRLERESFSGLDELECLDLSENLLNYLPPDWALPLKKLSYLNVNSNQFATISEMGIYSVISLEYLFVRNNTLSKITNLEIEPLPDLITVYLA